LGKLRRRGNTSVSAPVSGKKRTKGTRVPAPVLGFPSIVKHAGDRKPVSAEPYLDHANGKTQYSIRTVTGHATFELPSIVWKVKEEEVGLANRWKTLRLPRPKHCRSTHCSGTCGLKKRMKKVSRRKASPRDTSSKPSSTLPQATNVNSALASVTASSAPHCGKPSLPAARKGPVTHAHQCAAHPYLASQPKVNVWNAGATVHAPLVNAANGTQSFTREEDCLPAHLQPFGGLRLLAPTMKRLTYSMQLGAKIQHEIHGVFAKHPTMISDVLAHIGREDCTSIDAHLVDRIKPCIRRILEQELPTYKPPKPTECCVADAVLLDHWQQAAKDPDTEAAQWLLHGAPAGITEPVKDCGIFPLYDPSVDTADVDASDLYTPADFANYSGVEADTDVAKEVARIIEQKHVLRFKSVKDAAR
jgi:hypothetical protein